jgi:DNA polymerase-3 subunit beta
MKITVETSTLARELAKLQGIVSARSTTPATQFALLTATSEGQLLIQATDLDVALTARIECRAEVPGQVAIRARELSDMVKNVQAETLTIEKEDNHWALLRGGTRRARLAGINPAEFPRITTAEDLHPVALGTRTLQRMISHTLFSVCTDEARPNITGGLLRLVDGERLVMVSTDGHRLSKMETRLPEVPSEIPREFQTGVVVPRKGLDLLARTLDVTEPMTLVGLSQSTIYFIYGNTQLSVRLIEAVFPNYPAVIPAEVPERRATVGRKEFLDKVRSVALLSSAKINNIRVAMEGDTCTLTAQDPDRGECEDRLPIEYGLGPVKAGFNHRYLQDVLGVLDSERVTLEMVDAMSASVMRPVDGDDGEDTVFIIMPMRL